MLNVFVRLRRNGGGRLRLGRNPRPGERPSARPRSPDRARSIARRRVVAGRGLLPNCILRAFPTGGQAVLTIVAEACCERRDGRCTWPVAKTAGLAGVSHRLAQMAIKRARRLGLIFWQEWPRRGARSNTNVIAIADPAWLEHLAGKAREAKTAKPKGAKTGCANLHTTGDIFIRRAPAAGRRDEGRPDMAAGEAVRGLLKASTGLASAQGVPSPP